MFGLKVRLVTAVEVAEAPGSPDLVEVVLDHQVLDHLVLFRRLYGDQVHAPLAAQVPSVKPAHGVALLCRNYE